MKIDDLGIMVIDDLGIMVMDYIEWKGKMGQEMFILSHFIYAIPARRVNLPVCIHIGLLGETYPEDPRF